jgi:hypothetical protein
VIGTVDTRGYSLTKDELLYLCIYELRNRYTQDDAVST